MIKLQGYVLASQGFFTVYQSVLSLLVSRLGRGFWRFQHVISGWSFAGPACEEIGARWLSVLVFVSLPFSFPWHHSQGLMLRSSSNDRLIDITFGFSGVTATLFRKRLLLGWYCIWCIWAFFLICLSLFFSRSYFLLFHYIIRFQRSLDILFRAKGSFRCISYFFWTVIPNDKTKKTRNLGDEKIFCLP